MGRFIKRKLFTLIFIKEYNLILYLFILREEGIKNYILLRSLNKSKLDKLYIYKIKKESFFKLPYFPLKYPLNYSY